MMVEKVQIIIEAALMCAKRPLTIQQLQALFYQEEQPDTQTIQSILQTLIKRYEISGLELKKVASGYRLQTRAELSPYLHKLLVESPPHYSQALLETLVIIAYKQPVTKAEIETIRGVTVNSQFMRTLKDRGWIRIVGYRNLPGKPAEYGTTKAFLDYFNFQSLTELVAQLALSDAATLPCQLSLTTTSSLEE